MTEDCPDIRTIELYLDSLVVIAPDEQGLHDVDGQVGHDQEGDGVPALHLSLSSDSVGTSSQTINNHWGLKQDLDYDQEVPEEELWLKTVEDRWTQTNEGIEEEAGETEEEEHVI